jgi:hypothetical protein
MLFFFKIPIVGVGSKLGPLGTSATEWPILPAPGDYDAGEFGGMKIGRGNRSTRRKPAPAPLCPPQIVLDQTRLWTWAAAVGRQRLTAWAMARPNALCKVSRKEFGKYKSQTVKNNLKYAFLLLFIDSYQLCNSNILAPPNLYLLLFLNVYLVFCIFLETIMASNKWLMDVIIIYS